MSSAHIGLIVYRYLYTPTSDSVQHVQSLLKFLKLVDIECIIDQLLREGRTIPARFLTWSYQQYQQYQRQRLLAACVPVPTDILHIILDFLETPRSDPTRHMVPSMHICKPLPLLPLLWWGDRNYSHCLQEHHPTLTTQSRTLLDILDKMEDVPHVQDFLQRYILYQFTQRCMSAHVGHAICYAAGLGETSIVYQLLREVKREQWSYVLNNVLFWAIRSRQWCTVEGLLDSFHGRDTSWQLRPFVLRQLGSLAKVQHILDVYNISMCPDQAEILWAVASAGRTNLLNTLLGIQTTNPTLTTKHVQGMETALHAACRYGHHDCVVSLLAHIPVDTHVDYTPLALAAHHGHYQVCALLLQQRADPSLGSTYRDKPVVRAVVNGHTPIVQLLLQHQTTNPNVIDAAGCTLLDNCITALWKHKYVDFIMLRLLHKHGGRVTKTTLDIQTFITHNRNDSNIVQK